MRILKSIAQRLNRRRLSSGRENPSVSDYVDESRLIAAMTGGGKALTSGSGHSRSKSIPVRSHTSSRDNDASSVSASSSDSYGDDVSFGGISEDGSDAGEPVEWTLPLVDEEVTEPQTMEQELKRLQTLQNYFVLDADGEVEFDRITRMASQIFDVPMSLVSLVDLGRQWFLSKVGVDATEAPRKHAFCAHVILNKYKILVVPDASKDFRFMENPFVTGAIKIRFYAGAALVSPEGYKLGTLCIISPEPRPQGLSSEQQNLLHEMAAMVVSAMVARRDRLVKQEYENRFYQVAQTIGTVNKSLSEAQASLQHYIAYRSWNMEPEEAANLGKLTRELDLQARICGAAVRNVLQDTPIRPKGSPEDEDGEIDTLDHTHRAQMHSAASGALASFVLDYDSIANPTTNMEKLFDNINAVVANFPFTGTVTCEIEKSVPREIVVEDLLLFRSTLNLLTHCMAAGEAQCEGNVHHTALRIRCMKNNDKELLIQCLQAGKPTSGDGAKALFKNRDSLLAPVATMVNSMGGKYGMFEGKWEHHFTASTMDMFEGLDSSSHSKQDNQSIFWTRIPFDVPEVYTHAEEQNAIRRNNLIKTHKATPTNVSASVATDKKGLGLASDPFQQALMEVGCGFRGMAVQ